MKGWIWKPARARVPVLLALAFALAFAPLGCKHKKTPSAETKSSPAQAKEGPGRLASTVHVGDPRMAAQLAGGFYGIENNAWRWTAQQFAVTLRPPYGAAQKGAALVLKLTVPPPVIGQNKNVTLSAAVAGTPLDPQTFSQAGEYTYKRDVPANLLAGDSVRVDFKLDKVMRPGGGDLRQLGIVVLSAGLEAK